MARLGVLLMCLMAISGCVPAPEPSLSDVAYGADPQQRLDIYPAQQGAPAGTLVLIHGGGFTSGTRESLVEWAPQLWEPRQHGWDVVNIDYRLQHGEHNMFPAALVDLSAAVRWVRQRGAAYGLSTNRIVVLGHSAGGTAAALLGTAANTAGYPSEPLERVQGWVSISGAVASNDPDERVRTLWTAWTLSSSTAARIATDAAAHVDHSDPPGYLIHGDSDPILPVSQLLYFKAAANTAGGSATLDMVDGPTEQCRGHVPFCGMDTAALQQWLDNLAAA